MPSDAAPGDRWVRLLLLAYPRGFRARHGADLERTCHDVLAREEGSGSRRLRLAADLLWSALRARWTALRHPSRHVVARVGRNKRGVSMQILLGQVRRSLRTLRRNPGFAAVAILTLGLGIGATTAIFSVVEAVLLSPLPYDDGDELVWVMNRYLPEGELGAVSHPEFWEFRKETRAFEDLAAIRFHSANLTGLDSPVRVQGMGVTPSYLGAVRARVALGRSFAPDDAVPGASQSAIVSHALWQSALGGDPDAIGRTILLDARAHTIVGVMSPEHPALAPYLFPGASVDFWTPFTIDPASFDATSVEVHNLSVVGRLADGVDPATAEEVMDGAIARLERTYPDVGFAGNREVAVTPLAERVAGDVGTTLTILLVAVGLLLLVACINVANVLLARGEARMPEATVHAALGAGRARLALQGIIESLILGLAGGALGLILAVAAQRALVGLAPPELPRLDEVGLDLSVFAFCAGASVLAGFLAGLLPSVRLLRGDLFDSLKAGGRSGGLGGARTLLRRGLVVGQVAAAVVIASAAALLGRSLMELRRVDPGFERAGLLMADVNAPNARYDTVEEVRTLYAALLERLEAVPGVESVAASWQTPLQGGMSDWPIRPNTEESEWLGADPNMVTNSYFETLGMRLLEGRLFDGSDLARPEGSVILGETAARRLFGDEPAVGRLVNIDFREEVWREVVGVVADVRARGLGSDPRPQTYVPLAEVPFGPNPSLTLTVRTSLSAGALRPALVDAMRSVDPDVPVGDVRSMTEQVGLSLGRERFLAILLGTFAGAALLLGAVGVYGVLAYDVSRQRREIGLRIALGARPDGVLRRVVRRAVVMGAAGIAVGVVGAVAAARLLEGFLYGVSSTDPVTLGLVALLVLTTAAVASYLPARRAARVDPLIALRED